MRERLHIVTNVTPYAPDELFSTFVIARITYIEKAEQRLLAEGQGRRG